MVDSRCPFDITEWGVIVKNQKSPRIIELLLSYERTIACKGEESNIALVPTGRYQLAAS